MIKELQFIAIGISLISLCVSALSLGWNIYRDIIFKPRLKVRISIRQIVGVNIKNPITYVIISATNFGPGIIQVNMIKAKKIHLLKGTKYAAIIHDYTNPLSGKLPAKLNIGDEINLLFPYNKDCFLKEDFTHIGIDDSFGKIHWVTKKELKKTKEEYKKEFPEGS